MDERITTAGIVRKEDLFLVGLRSTEGSVNEGRWEFIGGKNRWGESVEDTLKREFMEELGVEVEVGRFLLSLDFMNKDTLYHLHVHEVTLLSDDFKLSVHSRLAWLSLDELSSLDFVDSDRRVIAAMREGRI